MASDFRKRMARFAKRFAIAFVVCFGASAAVVALFFFGPTSGERYRTPQLRETFFNGLVLYPKHDDLVANLPEGNREFTDSLPPLRVDFAFIYIDASGEQTDKLSVLDGGFMDDSEASAWVSPDEVVIDVAPERAEELLSRINSVTRERLHEYGLSAAGRGEMRVEQARLPNGTIRYRTKTMLHGGHLEYRAQYEVREGKSYLSSWSYHTHRSIGNAPKFWAAGILSAIIALMFATGSFGPKHRTFLLTGRNSGTGSAD